jgi:secondary thiamine-phosphate synthase enzyme
MTPLIQERQELAIDASGPAMVEITAQAAAWIASIGARDGLLTVFLRHTSASLTIQENRDTTVRADLLAALARLAPEGAGYRHSAEGIDDMPAHIKTMLTSVSLSIPVFEGALALGTWQGIYLIEHRKRRSTRKIILHFVGVAVA